MESPEGQVLSVLCLDYGYKLAGSPSDLTRPQIHFLISALNNRRQMEASARAATAGMTQIVFSDEYDEE